MYALSFVRRHIFYDALSLTMKSISRAPTVLTTIEKCKSGTTKLAKSKEEWIIKRKNVLKYAASVSQKTDVLRKKIKALKDALGVENAESNEDDGVNEDSYGIQTWTAEEVSDWVRDMDLPDAAAALKEADINGFVLTQLNRRQLTEIGVQDMTRQNILLGAVNRELGLASDASPSPVARRLWESRE